MGNQRYTTLALQKKLILDSRKSLSYGEGMKVRGVNCPAGKKNIANLWAKKIKLLGKC